MKIRKIFLMILSICIITLLCGCTPQIEKLYYENLDYIDEEELSVLFENNETDLTAVVNELWPIVLDGATFKIENKYLVARDGDTNTFALSNERQAIILSCLQEMETFIQNNYNNADWSVFITSRNLFGDTPVIEFAFIHKKSNSDSGILYTTEQLEGDGWTKIRDNWYFYCYAGVL